MDTKRFSGYILYALLSKLVIDIENIPLVHWPHRNGSWGDVKLTSWGDVKLTSGKTL